MCFGKVISKDHLPLYLTKKLRKSEAILILGARDPSLPMLAREIQEVLKGHTV